MEIEIAKDHKNPLSGRREIEFYIVQDSATPKKAEIKQSICSKLNLNPDSTVIIRVDQAFGVKSSKGIVHSYDTPEAMKAAEQEHLFDRGTKKEKKERKEKAAADAAAAKQ